MSHVSSNISLVLEFLTDLFEKGLQVNSLCVVRAGLSAHLEPIDTFAIGSHPAVIKLFKGMYNVRPRSFKDKSTWKVDTVLEYIIDWGPNWSMDMYKLTLKLAMLLALSSGARSSEICALTTNNAQFLPNGVRFLLNKHKKNRKTSVLPGTLFFPYFMANKNLCPVSCLEHYLLKTFGHRLYEGSDTLFRAINKPTKGVQPCTVSRWLTQTIALASGWGTDKLIGHSVRSLSASKAKIRGLSVREIMESVEWKSESTFRYFYDQSPLNDKFGQTVLTI